MNASASNFARRTSVRQWQGRTPLSTTNSHPVPEQEEQIDAGCLAFSHCLPSRDESGAASFATAYSEYFFANSLDILLLLLTSLAGEGFGQLANFWSIFRQKISACFCTDLGQSYINCLAAAFEHRNANLGHLFEFIRCK